MLISIKKMCGSKMKKSISSSLCQFFSFLWKVIYHFSCTWRDSRFAFFHFSDSFFKTRKFFFPKLVYSSSFFSHLLWFGHVLIVTLAFLSFPPKHCKKKEKIHLKVVSWKTVIYSLDLWSWFVLTKTNWLSVLDKCKR